MNLSTRLILSSVFILGAALFAFSLNPSVLLILSAGVGAYMAINIGANDVANNVGPAVGSKALTLTGALIIAAIFETSGALIAGGDVVKTIKKGIINPDLVSDPSVFIFLMFAALIGGALWLNIATYLRVPVSTTHSIVGGVAGAGIAATGLSIVDWAVFGKIVLSWIISPVLGGIIAAIFLYFIKKTIVFKDNMVSAATKIVPYLIGVMTWVFSTYLIVKGLKHLFKTEFIVSIGIGFVIGAFVFFIVKPLIKLASKSLESSRESIDRLFTFPMIFSVALLSFAHGANDVANAIGPLAGIYDSIVSGDISAKVGIPFWIMLLGGLGLSVGLILFGPRLIKTVGSEITQLNQMRAFSVAMAAGITVIIASQLGLPVSSTHIAIGGIFGVGFLREYLSPKDKKEKLVHRTMFNKIILAWVITVPVAGAVAGSIYLLMNMIL